MENPKVSVIMPIYNVEDYLEDTLNNLLKQSFIDNIEVLMVDDGSTDNSRYIIEKYALDYDNFHAFHKENEGLFSTRIYGISKAKGEYIHFLDADDIIVNDGYEKLYKIATENDSYIVTAPIIRLRRYNIFDGKFYENSLKKFDHDVYSTKFQSHPELIWDLFVTNKLYKLEFLKNHDLNIIGGNKSYCDDSPFSLKNYLLADNISISTDIFYYWRLRENENLSITQKISEVENFYDRIYSINLSLNEIKKNDLNENLLKEFYLKILNHDLYLHLRKFHIFDEKDFSELLKESKAILKVTPNKYKEKLNSYKKIIYKMVEEEDVDGLVNFSSLESELKSNPYIPDNLDEKYHELIDFDNDALNEKLIARKEEITVDNDNLIIKFRKRLNYLKSSHSCQTNVTLIDDDNGEFTLNEEDSKIIIPIDLIKDKNHMKIRVECDFESFKKECYLTNSKRELIELDDFDIEIGIGINNIFYIDIRKTNGLMLEIEDVTLENEIFSFSGVSNKEISEVYIQNVVTFDKISYDVKSEKEDENYRIDFSIPYEDILSINVRKWELKVNGGFKNIELIKKFEFYNQYDFIYMINLRNNVLISFDFYHIYEKLDTYKNNVDNVKSKNKKLVLQKSKLSEKNSKFKEKNIELKEKNTNLREKNKNLKEKNAKLKEKNTNLREKNKKLREKNNKQKEIINLYKSRKIVRFVDKIKKIFK